MTKSRSKKNQVVSIADALRAPHHATAEVVELVGSDIAKQVYAAFRQFNETHFEGELAAGLVLITNTASSRTFGDYCARDVHGIDSRIRLAPKTLAKGERFWLDVLLHEMIHAWQAEIVEDTENGYRGHGPVFARKCNEIGAALGLPPVGVKGRDGLPNCAHWPCNVRPEGYYGEAYKAPTRKPNKPKAPAGEGGEGGEGGESPSATIRAMARLLARLLEDSKERRLSAGDLHQLDEISAHLEGIVSGTLPELEAAE